MSLRPTALSRPLLILLHLLPGAIATLLFIVLVGPVQAAGHPPLAAFLIAIGLVIIPFELGAVFVAGWRAEPNKGLLAAIPYRRLADSRSRAADRGDHRVRARRRH